MNSKAELRRQLLRQRRALSPSEWQTRSDRLCENLQRSPLLASATTALAYFSFRQEPDLDPLFRLPQWRWGFPRCVGENLQWHFWQPGDRLVTGAYGIREPHPEAEVCSAENVDAILVPAVACDRRGYRLGYGGGYYDRFLALPQWQGKLAIGIAFDFALLDKVPIEPWDRQLAGVCTDKGWSFVA